MTMSNLSSIHIGVVFWQEDAELNRLASSTCLKLGCEVTELFYDEQIPQHLDMILAFGPFGSLVPVAMQLLSIPLAKRPKLALWMTEQFPNPFIPEWALYPVSMARSWGERFTYQRDSSGVWTRNQRLKWVTNRALRFRYYGDLHWLRNNQILSLIAVGSKWIARYLQKKGFNPLVAYIGSHPEWGDLLNVERNIPVIWLGKLGTDRRRRVLDRVRKDLHEFGVEVLMIDGVENPYVFGHERTVILNRTKIAINVLREEWDNHSLRYFLSAQNGVLVVTEPTLPHTPFISGEHIVDSSIDRMADVINHYLNNEFDRKQIVDKAYRLVKYEITMEKSVSSIIERVLFS
jgi:hypothetical protein